MNSLTEVLVGVAKRYLGPAAPTFVARELRQIGASTNTVESAQVKALADRVEVAAGEIMGPQRAAELAGALRACAARAGATKPRPSEHRLASDAAAHLLALGKVEAAERAYRELADRHGGAEVFHGLAKAALARGDRATALGALRDGAVAAIRAQDRTAAVALLLEAVQLAPTDLAVHRRLAATLANQGDVEGACEEQARFIDALVARGEVPRAWLELTYAREMLGERPGVLAIADRLVRASAAPAKEEPPAAKPEPEVEPPIDLFERVAARRKATPPAPPDLESQLAALVPAGATGEAAAVADSRASVLISARDPRAADAAVDAARRLLALRKLTAASDVLLACLGAGLHERQVHCMLVEVQRAIGRSDLARQKCELLARMYELDGLPDIAAELRRVAGTIAAPKPRSISAA